MTKAPKVNQSKTLIGAILYTDPQEFAKDGTQESQLKF